MQQENQTHRGNSYNPPTETDIIHLLSQSSLDHKRSGEEIVIKICPWCQGDTSKIDNQWKLNIKNNDGRYLCHRCESKGNWLTLQKELNGSAGQQYVRSKSKLKKVKELWDKAIPLSDSTARPVRKYLENRGLSSDLICDEFRYDPDHQYFEGGGSPLFESPALISRVKDEKGNLCGVHRIYLTNDGQKANVDTPKKVLGGVKGGAIRISEATSVLGLAEGIETALAVQEGTSIPMWSTLTATGMKQVVIPNTVKMIFIWADLDKSETGTNAAEELAHRLFREGKSVYVITPDCIIPEDQKSIDWLDIFNEDKQLLPVAKEKATRYLPSALTEIIDRETREKNNWPKPIKPEAWHGLAGDFVNCISPHTEADSMGVLTQFLCAFGNMVGRNVFITVDGTRHYPNLYTVQVGDSAKSRKGTSWNHVKRFMSMINPEWTKYRLQSGLSSGEGLIQAVRDAVVEQEEQEDSKTGEVMGYTDKITDPGVEDKRLFVQESEFASVLRVADRQGSILNTIIRDAWDNGDLATMTRHSPLRATDAHISISGHVTEYELRKILKDNDAFNGFANRFLWICVRRSKLLPLGGNVDYKELERLQWFVVNECLPRIQHFGESRLSVSAIAIYTEAYKELSASGQGLFWSMIARGEAQVLRLALIYSLLDCSPLVEEPHIKAALAVWKYCEDSCKYLFSNEQENPVANRILEALRSYPEGLIRCQIREIFHGHKKSKELDQAMELLVRRNLVIIKKEKQTGGRPSERWLIKPKTPAR